MSTKKRLKSASKPPKKAGNCIFADHKFNFSLGEEKVPGFMPNSHVGLWRSLLTAVVFRDV